jgi:hypothetical protein
VTVWAWAAPWWLLTAGMAVDEFHFHYERGLPRWERLGHPIDTAGVLAFLAACLLAPFSAGWGRGLAALGLASMGLITKDEAVHAERCGAGESWLHAVLFLLHPLALLSGAAAWAAPSGRLAGLGLGPAEAVWLREALGAQFCLTALFMVYQAVYWNLVWNEPAPASTTISTKN